MAQTAQQLRVEIIGDSRGYSKALGEATSAGSRFASGLGRVAKTAALAAGAAGIGAIAVTLKQGFSEWQQSAKVAAQTAAVLKSTGGAANVTAKQVDDLGTAIMRKSGIDDEAIKTSENMLLTFTGIRNEVGKGNDIFNQAASAVADMDVAMTHGSSTAESLSKTSILVGKALNDPIKGATALRRVGVQLTEQQVDQIKAFVASGETMKAQKVILGELTKEFGGSAKALGDTVPGQVNKLKESFNNLAGDIFAKLVPSLQRMVDWTNANWPQIESVFNTVADGIGWAISNVVAPALQAMIRAGQAVVAWVQSNWPQITAVFNAVGSAVGSAMSTVAGTVRTHWGTISGVFTELLSVGRNIVRFFQSEFGQTGAATVAAAAVIGGAVSKISAALKTLRLAFAFRPELVALALAAGYMATKFFQGKLGSDALTSALKAQKDAADALKGNLDGLAQANLDVETAHHQVTATTNNLAAALRAEAEASDGSAKKTLAEKQAHDNVVSAQDARAQSILNLRDAQQRQTDLQAKSNDQLKAMVPTLTEWANKIVAGTNAQTASFPIFEKASMAANKLTLGLVGASKSHEDVAKAARLWGLETEKAGAATFLAGQKLEKTNPLVAASQRVFGGLQIAAGELAGQMGKIPTNKKIVATAKMLGGKEFVADLKAFISGAEKAGVQIPKWLRDAVVPSGKAATDIKSGVKTPLDQLPAAGQAAGVGAGQGVARGIVNSTAAAVVAAESLKAQVKTVLSSAWGSPPDQWGKDAVGSPLVKGIAAGIIQSEGLATGAAERTKQAIKARLQAQELVAVAAEWGKRIGSENARAILSGFLQQDNSLKAQYIAKAKEKAAEMAQAVKDSTGAFRDAFSSLAQQALSAFDEKWSGWTPPAQKLLDKMQLQDQINQAKQAITDAQTQLATAQKDARTAAEALATAAPTEGETPEDFAARKAELQRQADETKAAVVAAVKSLGDARRAQTELNLQLEIAQQQKAHDAKIAKERENLAKSFVLLQEWLAKHPGQWQTMYAKVKKILDDAGVKMTPAGQKWASNFADGIRKGIGDAVAAAKALAAAVDAYMPHSPAKKGPFAVDPAKMMQSWSERFASGLQMPSVAFAGAGISAGGGGMAGAGGGLVVNVYVEGSVTSEQELSDAIYRSLERRSGRNAGRILGR